MRTAIFSFIISMLSFNLTFGQKFFNTDSVNACKVTSEFFDWYVGAIKGTIKTSYQPRFAKSNNGMTTLDFKGYFDNLKRLHCTDNLIQKERDSYNECLSNLSKIKFTDFETRFTDLDQFESINCDFENYYRWTGGQEPIDGIKIERVARINTDAFLVTVTYYVDNGQGYGLSYWGTNKLSIVKQNEKWMINDINWRE
jgi:hypothetical protein